ncbi:HD domain-containing protein [[Kitasatospora] papulosa]|uniref:HD domain-containing protein n=1 Tax=[Kitasatospora] papulosa TaxID=1464011 RepID=UPI0036C69190
MHEELPTGTTVDDVRALAERAHAGQVDKIGVVYFAHVQAVAAGLASFGDDLVMAGLLHDVIEDTDWTAERLLAAGVPGPVVAIVEMVTNQDGVPYEDKIRRITRDPLATLVKIADNAHNSRADRAAQLPAAQRDRLAAKYRAARSELWPAARRDDIEAIVRIVNPALLTELNDHVANTSTTMPGSSDGSAGPAAVNTQKR